MYASQILLPTARCDAADGLRRSPRSHQSKDLWESISVRAFDEVNATSFVIVLKRIQLHNSIVSILAQIANHHCAFGETR